MSAVHALVSMDRPAPLSRLPIYDAIRRLAGIAGKFAPENTTTNAQNSPPLAILVDEVVDDARYLLVRVPKLQPPALPELLPLPRPQRRITEIMPVERRHKFGDLRRALVAEHDSATRLRLLRLLREWGFNVVIANNGNEALSSFEQQPPDLLIMNRSLPGVNGIELCRRISSASGEQAPYILMMGRRTGRRCVVESLESGAADYLSTPFDEQELRARLIVAVRALARQDSLIKAREQFRDQACRDPLTGVWNRRGILEILEDELDRAERNARATGILMLDLDHFKNVNDEHGHLAGDLVLQETANRLSHSLRAYDGLSRFGGEEFLIVVPATDEKELCDLAERIRAAFEAAPIHTELNDIQITCSIGAALANPGDRSNGNVIAAADQALYKAKKLGRNRVVFGVPATELPPGTTL